MEQREAPAPVLLVSMPFRRIGHGSIGLATLKALLTREGVRADVLYLCVDYAREIGVGVFDRITDDAGYDLLGEWVFAEALFGGRAPAVEPFLSQVSARRDDDLAREAAALRAGAGAWLDRHADAIVARGPKIVGFTSLFQQHAASLALAERIKARAPDTVIMFGGANCEGPMGLETVRQFACVDAVVSGEADVVFPELVRRVLAGRSVSDMTGVYTRAERRSLTKVAPVNAPRAPNLDDLPIPDFDDWFVQLDAAMRHLPEGERPTQELLLETSRGCWWGETHHCTFCGLSEDIMVFRAKSPARALAEIESQIARYGVRDIATVDNILALEYFKELLPLLAKRGTRTRIFYELKANLKRDHVRLLAEAGVVMIQPGIESFSTPILKAMKKGLTQLSAIQTLKWCAEFGVSPVWLILCGFPGEAPEEYARMTELLPLLTHLPPPTGGVKIRLERFSPNYEESADYGFINVRPRPTYSAVYPFPPEVVANLAYYFDYDYADGRDIAAYVDPLRAAIGAWRAAYPKEQLVAQVQGDALVVTDTRAVAKRRTTRLEGLARAVYRACEAATSIDSILRVVSATTPATRAEVEAEVDALVEAQLMLRDGEQALALAIDPFARLPALQLRALPRSVSATR